MKEQINKEYKGSKIKVDAKEERKVGVKWEISCRERGSLGLKGRKLKNKKRSSDDAEGKNVNRGKEKRVYMGFFSKSYRWNSCVVYKDVRMLMLHQLANRHPNQRPQNVWSAWNHWEDV